MPLFFSAGLAVFHKRTHLLLSVRHAGPAESSLWIARRLPVLSELCRRLFSLDFPDHREGVLQSVCVRRLRGGQDGDPGGRGVHRRRGVDPGWTRRAEAGLLRPARGAVFIPGGVGALPRRRVPQWLRVLFKADSQRRNGRIKMHFVPIFIINTDDFCICVRAELWETTVN